MKDKFLDVISIFDRNDLHPKGEAWNALIVFSSWAVSSFLFVVWASTYHPENQFYQAAIDEGIGPNLWNAIGSFGLFSFGVAILTPTLRMPSSIAKTILSNTYAIGCLTFGLLVGQWVLLPYHELSWWQQGLFGITSSFLLAIVFVLNLVAWYLSFLIDNSPQKKSGFIDKLTKTHWLWRAGLGLSISGISLLVFLYA